MNATGMSVSPDRSNSPPLFGREREELLLRQHLEAMLHGDGRLILVSGEAGIGKTSLVNLIASEAMRAGALVLTGHCYDLTATSPYGPWSEIAERYRPDEQSPKIPEVLRRGTGMAEITNQSALFDVARGFLFSVATSRPLVLVLEDLHWSDPESLDLLRYLARQLDEHRIVIIATYRDDEVTRQHKLFQILPVLVREADAIRIDLRALTEDDISNLVNSRYQLPASEHTRLRDYLQLHGDGNPLFTRELLRTLEEDGFLRPDGQQWVLGDLSAVPIPKLIQQVIERRLLRLSDEHRSLLEAAAVIGHDVPLDVWQRATGATDDTIISTIERAISSNLLIERSSEYSVSFSHALIREALYTGIVVPRRRTLHRRSVDVLMTSPTPDPDVAAFHLLQAGDDRAVDWLIRAGERAQSAYAWRTSAQRFQTAAESLAINHARMSERGWLFYRAGRLNRYGDQELAIRLLDEAERIGNAVDDKVLSAYALADRGVIRCFANDFQAGLHEMKLGDKALDSLPADHLRSQESRDWTADVAPNLRRDRQTYERSDQPAAGLNLRRGSFVVRLALAGRLSEALTLGVPYSARIAAIEDPDDTVLSSYADITVGLAWTHAAGGQPDLAHEEFTDARAIMRRIGHHIMVAGSASHELDVLTLPYRTTRLDERRELERTIAAGTPRIEHAVTHGLSDHYLANLRSYWVDGRWKKISEVAPIMLDSGLSECYYRAASSLAILKRATGEPEAAATQIASVLPHGPATEPGGTEFLASMELQRLAIHLALDASRYEDAHRWLSAHDAWLSWSGSDQKVACVGLATFTWHMITRLR